MDLTDYMVTFTDFAESIHTFCKVNNATKTTVAYTCKSIMIFFYEIEWVWGIFRGIQELTSERR